MVPFLAVDDAAACTTQQFMVDGGRFFGVYRSRQSLRVELALGLVPTVRPVAARGTALGARAVIHSEALKGRPNPEAGFD